MSGLAAGLLAVLVLTGSLGIVQAVTGAIVFAVAAFAYLAGTSGQMEQSVRPAPETERGAAPRSVGVTMLNAIPLPAFELDKDERIVAFNTPAGKLLSLNGRAIVRASSAIRSPALLAAVGRAGFTGTVDIEDDLDGFWRAHINPISEADRTLVMLEDLTPLRRAAQARSDFLANASHELRTPLTAISGFIETLRGPARDDPAAWGRFLDIMANETERMKRLITDLLSLSRIEASGQAAPVARDDLVEIANRTVKVMQPLAETAGVSLVLTVPEDPAEILTATDEMVQVIENLVSNALKYSQAGGEVRVQVGLSNRLSEAREASSALWADSARMLLLQHVRRPGGDVPAVWLRVEDDGPGIEREHLPRLGERFYRADESRGGKITGTGLGLAIVKHIMAHHRGGLAVETRAGQGTAFSVWFPQAPKEKALSE